MNLINEEKAIVEKKNREQELLINDQQDIIKNYSEELQDLQKVNKEQFDKIQKLEMDLQNSIEKEQKNSFNILEGVKKCMTDSNEVEGVIEDPFKTIPSIKFIEGCEEVDDHDESKSVKVVSSCSSNVAEGYR